MSIDKQADVVVEARELLNSIDKNARVGYAFKLLKALADEAGQLRDWKESALPLLNRYENLAETFSGELGSLRVENLERGVTALREQLAHRTIELERESRETQKWNNRANRLAIEGQGLRDQLAQVTAERDELRDELRLKQVVDEMTDRTLKPEIREAMEKAKQ